MSNTLTTDQRALLIHLMNELERKDIPLKEFIERLEAMKNETILQKMQVSNKPQ